jgi:hypothetical protein
LSLLGRLLGGFEHLRGKWWGGFRDTGGVVDGFYGVLFVLLCGLESLRDVVFTFLRMSSLISFISSSRLRLRYSFTSFSASFFILMPYFVSFSVSLFTLLSFFVGFAHWTVDAAVVLSWLLGFEEIELFLVSRIFSFPFSFSFSFSFYLSLALALSLSLSCSLSACILSISSLLIYLLSRGFTEDFLQVTYDICNSGPSLCIELQHGEDEVLELTGVGA